jgi:hypothetical protein
MEPEEDGAAAGGSGGGAALDADFDDADVHELAVPHLEAVAIEFPGYIRNPDRALAALGGPAAAAAALDARASVLKCWLRPEDPLSHPLFGERRRARSVLLRVARPRTTTTNAAGATSTASGPSASDPADGDAVTVTAIATVGASYRFNGLADYQYLPVDLKAAVRSFAALPEKNRPESAEVYKRPQPFLLVPPLFSKTDVAMDFAFKDGARGEGAAAEGEAEGPRGRVRVISFYEPETPQPLPLPLPLPAGQQRSPSPAAAAEEASTSAEAAAAALEAAEKLAAAFEELRARLEERPVWPVAALVQDLPEGADEGEVAAALAALCYQFKTGGLGCCEASGG